MHEERNWAGNYTYSTTNIFRPETLEQTQETVRSQRKLRVLGTRHSFNDIADSPAALLSLERFTPAPTIDRERHTVTVGGRIRYGQLCRQLDDAGYALHNMASLPHISVAGGSATATHGSGERHGNLATAVTAVEMVTADGEVVRVSREHHGDQFPGVVVGLGGLGVVTQLTLQLVPAFTMRQDVYENLSLAQVDEHFDEIIGRGYSVSLFTDWQHARFTQVWVKRQVADDAAVEPAEPTLFGATLATRPLHPIAHMSAENCTQQLGVPGPWYERLPHFRMEFTPSSGAELQTEYLMPRQHAVAAFHAIDRIRDEVAPLLQISEVRTIAADTLWMSPCYGQDCVAIHFTWHPDWVAVANVLPLIEAQLAPFDARPHWGKLFTMSPAQVQALFPRLPDFQRLLEHYDPQGKFRNPFMDTYIAARQRAERPRALAPVPVH